MRCRTSFVITWLDPDILLDEAQKDSEIHKDLNLIVEQSNRCKKIVGGLLNFARKNQINSSKVDLIKLAEQSTDAVIIPKNISVNINHEDLNDKIATLDSEQIIQILTNLLKNAIDAMPQGGNIDIILDDDNENIIIYVKDSGVGISTELLDKIFEPFYTTKGIGKGTGLGLATAYGIVKMHKGKISVESNNKPQKGKTGTTFKISLPRFQ